MSTTTTTAPADTARSMWVDEVVRVSIVQARQAALVAVTKMEETFAARREADAELRLRADQLADTRLNAEYMLDTDSWFAKEGATTYLTRGATDDDKPMHKAVDAKQRAEYIAWIVSKDSEVIAATEVHRQAVRKAEDARDAAVVAEKRVSATKYDLQAAGTMLNTLTTLTTCFNQTGRTQ